MVLNPLTMSSYNKRLSPFRHKDVGHVCLDIAIALPKSLPLFMTKMAV